MVAPPETLSLQAADGARADIRLQGAHVLSWIPAGESGNRLFLSRLARYAPGEAVRGGVPVIFPQFASEGALPKHGFARTALWSAAGVTQDADGSAVASFRLADSDDSRRLWPQAFAAELRVAILGCRLEMTLAVRNTGDDAFDFTAALHTYLRVSEIANVRIHGLHGLRYRDSAAGNRERIETPEASSIAGEVDRIYFDAPPGLRVEEASDAGGFELHQQGFTDTVIWNPGAERAAALADLEPDGWRRMLCVEAAAIGRPPKLLAGEIWRGSQTLIAL